jgi:hypothetical protein
MRIVAQLSPTTSGHTAPDVSTATNTLIDAAAAIETELQQTKHQNELLTQEVQRWRQQAARARYLIVMLRRSHRSASHNSTCRLFADVLGEFAVR